MRTSNGAIAWALPELTLAVAPTLCAGAVDQVAHRPSVWTLDLRQVARTDVFGLAALLQSVQRARAGGITVRVLGNALVRNAIVEAHLAGELALDDCTTAKHHASITTREPRRYLAETERMGLRVPRESDLPFFAEWAASDELEQLVGSDLLYRCRHLGVEHPGVRSAVLADSTAVTLLIEPREDDAAPVGYIRLYQIHLADGFGFLEVTVADPRYRRGAYGVVATYVFLGLVVDALELNRIEAKAYVHNQLSCNGLRRRGFTQEGVLREAHRADGGRADIAIFALFGDDMRARRYRDPLPYRGFWPREFHAARAAAPMPSKPTSSPSQANHSRHHDEAEALAPSFHAQR